MKPREIKKPLDRIEGQRIIICAGGRFPKELIVYDREGQHVYKIIKTKYGKYQLVKAIILPSMP